MELIGYEKAALNIEVTIAAKKLTQGAWQKDGHKIACLLGAIHADVNSAEDACAATGMPDWMGHLVPVLFDGLPKKDIYDYGLKFATSMKSWQVLDENSWDRVLVKFKIFTVKQALEFARPKGPIPDYWQAVENACLQTIDALNLGDKQALAAAAASARAAAYAAADAAANAAYTAYVSARAAADADYAAARAAAYAAANAAYAAANTAYTAYVSARAAYAAQFDALLEFIGQELKIVGE
jgi:hypothetical protein